MAPRRTGPGSAAGGKVCPGRPRSCKDPGKRRLALSTRSWVFHGEGARRAAADRSAQLAARTSEPGTPPGGSGARTHDHKTTSLRPAFPPPAKTRGAFPKGSGHFRSRLGGTGSGAARARVLLAPSRWPRSWSG